MRRTAAVTGASSGIGWTTAEEFARRGYDVVVIARRADRLGELVDKLGERYPGQKFLAKPCDVTRWDQVQSLAESLPVEFSHLKVLVNNAGAYDYAPLENANIEKLDELIDVNVRGVVYMTKALLPRLKPEKSSGRSAIVNVSSIAGLWGFSRMAVYSASKFAITGFTSSLSRELKPEGIDVLSIHPGPVRTQAHEAGLPKKWSTMLPDQVARQIADSAENARSRVISHPAFSLLNALEHVSPQLVDRLLRKIL